MKRAALIAFAIMGGCSTVAAGPSGPPVVTMASRFDPAEVSWFAHPGSNAIRGNALLRTVGGDVKTCAGFPVRLVPMSTYARERFSIMYAGGESGLMPAREPVTFDSTDPEYVRLTRETVCDSQGNFAFESLPDGEYYLTAQVTWGVPMQYFTRTEGGILMQRISVRGGETRQVVLTYR